MPKASYALEMDSRFILIGEDDPDDQELLKETFTHLDDDMSLWFVNSGIEVVQTLEKLPEDKHPCLLVLDYNMPGLNGGEILKAINGSEKYSSIPKILWSTSGADKYRQACLNLGAHDYFIKPASYNELEKIARYMLQVCKKKED